MICFRSTSDKNRDLIPNDSISWIFFVYDEHARENGISCTSEFFKHLQLCDQAMEGRGSNTAVVVQVTITIRPPQ